MSRSLMKLFGNRLALVGMTRGEDPIGQWTKKQISGVPYWFFPVSSKKLSARKPFVPARLEFYVALKRYRREILSLGSKSAFTQCPEALLAVSPWNWDSLCFWFPGVESPLKASRYRFARPLFRWFDSTVFRALEGVEVILAAADEAAINNLVLRSRGRLSRERIHQVPTCVDTTEFHPDSIADARAALGIPLHSRVFVNSGRIGRLKGWELLVDAFEDYLKTDPDALLYFAGDGEDRPPLEKRIAERNLQANIKITGFLKRPEIVSYLNAADAVVFGSFVEGWSVSMLEALACGKAIVSTGVSGIDSMVVPGENGFVVNSRDPAKFSEAMRNAVALPDAARVSTSIASNFDLTRMGERLARLWRPFRSYELPNESTARSQLLRFGVAER